MIQINPEADAFLLDHVVDGSPLLPTVMQLDLVARELLALAADQGTEQSAGMHLRDIRVGPPVRFSPPGTRQLELRCAPDPFAPPGNAATRCELRSPGYDAPHLTAVAVAEPGGAPAQRVPAPDGWAADLRCGPDLVYPPYFHGPAFRVVGAFGRAGAGLAAALAPGLPPLGWGNGPTVLRPRLLELLMQCCGLHELADTGRMMIPDGIEAAHWHPGSLAPNPENTAHEGTAHENSAVTVVVPRPRRHERDRVFDGQVATPDGTPLLTVTGYRTVDLGRPADLAHAGRLTRCLASHCDPVPAPPAGTAVSEGV